MTEAPAAVMYGQPMREKSMWEKTGPLIMVLVVVMAFALGVMWNRVKNLEANGGAGSAAAGTGAAAAVAGKYKSFKAAADDYAKQINLDVKKMDSCVQSGGKEAEITAEEAEGSTLGVQGTPGFFINGRFLGGAFPYEAFKEVIDNELAGKGSNDLKAYSQTLQGAAAQQAFNPVPKQVNIGNAPTQGPADAKVIIVEYSDFQCPFCEQAYQTFKQVNQNYNGKYLFVYKEFPLRTIHPNAEKAAEVAACAKEQGKFWEMHNKLFDNQNEWASLPGGW